MVNQRAQILKELVEMGLSEDLARTALDKCDNNKERAISYIFDQNDSSSSALVPYGPLPSPASQGLKSDDDEINKAIAMSLQDSHPKPTNSEQKEREVGIPAGLKPFSSLPFLNALVQLYFSVPAFKKVIENQNLSQIEEVKDPKHKKSFRLLKELQILFERLDKGKFKFEDSTALYSAIVDIESSQVNAEKNQVAEFSMKFVARVEEALKALNQPEREEASPRKDSVSFFTDEAIVSSLFYGKNLQVTEWKETDGTKAKNESAKMLFGKIEVRVDEKDLYEAWHSAYRKKTTAQNSNGNPVNAKQTTWIDTLPEVLIFDINRTETDPNGNTIKVKKPFHFPLVLHPGRFLWKNNKKAKKLQKSMIEKKRRVKQLSTSISKFTNFNGSEHNLAEILTLCSKFLNSQGNREESFEDTDIQVYSPSGLLPVEGLEKATSLIGEYAFKVTESVQKMKEEHNSSLKEIEETFDKQNLKETIYVLSGIIVHNGEVGGGEYFVYLNKDGLWKKYHDANVTQVNEKNVMYESLGEYGYSAACCLVYTSQARSEGVGKID